MQQVIEGMMGIFFTVFMVFTGIDMARGFVNSNEALAFKTEAITMLENGHYEEEVVNACYKEAEQRGFELNITFFYSDGTWSMRDQGGIRAEELQGVTMAKVSVEYPFQIGMLKLDTRMETCGVAY